MNKVLLLSATDYEHKSKEIFSQTIHLIGLGKISAAHRTTELIKKFNPDIVINFGSCGNLKKYKVGELLEVGKVFNNIDARPLAEYGETPFECINAINLQGNSSIKCFTTDQFYHRGIRNYRKEYLSMIKKCDIVDMELYSIAWCCMKMNKKLYSYKWVSDDGSSDDWNLNASKGFENFKNIYKDKFL